MGSYRDPQTVFPNYLNHTAATAVIAPYLNSSNIAQAYGKPFLMFETNTGERMPASLLCLQGADKIGVV